MPSDRSILEHQMADVELRPFTLDEFHRRRHRKQRNRRIGTAALGLVLAAVAVAGVLGTVVSDSDEKTITTDDVAGPGPQPQGPYVGSWESTDTDGSHQSMVIRRSGSGEHLVVMHDDLATGACAGAPATVTGTGLVETDGTLRISAEVTCDDGSTPAPQGDPAVAPELRDGLAHLTFAHDQETGTLVDNFGVVWRRPGAAPAGAQRMNVETFDEDVEPGTYYLDPDGDESTPLLVTYEVAAEGWSTWPGAVKLSDKGHTAVTITSVDNVVTQACEDPTPQDPAIGPTVDDLATALSELAPFELTEPPNDVTLLGYQGKHLKITVPDLEVTGSGGSAYYADCVNGNMHSWIDRSGEPFFGYNAEPGRYDEYWILDVDGTRLVISINSSPAMPPEELEEAQAIIDSIELES